MDKIFETSLFNRKKMVSIIEEMTHEQLIKIPKGYNNSIIWNIAHLLVAQQLLTYKLSRVPINIKDELVEKYKKGSKADTNVSKEEVAYIKSQLIQTVIKTQVDYKNGVFTNFDFYPTSTGIDLNNIDDSLQFMAFHDGIHLGVILSLKKVV